MHMKVITLAIVFITLSLSFSKPIIRKIDKRAPIYLKVLSLDNDAEDDLSIALKKQLISYGFRFVNHEDYNQLVKDYYSDVRLYMQMHSTPGTVQDEAFIEKMYRSGAPSQRLSLYYKAGGDHAINYQSCDTIGISIFKMPFVINFHTVATPVTLYFSKKEIATNNPDSIAQFLISKL